MSQPYNARRPQIGEGFAGSGASAAHVNTVYGPRDGAVGTAFATALATPTAGHTPFLAVLQPGLAVVPPTLFVNKATYACNVHSRATWGPAQAGLAEGVRDALAAGLLANVDDCCLIAAVWVDPGVAEADFSDVCTNNRTATLAALRAGAYGAPNVTSALNAGAAWNPFFDPRDAAAP